MSFSTLTSSKSKPAHVEVACHECSWVHLTVACVPVKHRAAFNLRSFLHESVFILLSTESHNVFLHLAIALVQTRFTMGAACHDSFCGKSHGAMCLKNTPHLHRSMSCPSSRRLSSSSASFNGHNVFLHFDIAQVKTRFTREPLVTNVCLVLTVACAEKHRAALNLRSFLHGSVFILLFIESPTVFLHFDIVLVRTNFTREPLVTTASSLTLTVACVVEHVPFRSPPFRSPPPPSKPPPPVFYHMCVCVFFSFFCCFFLCVLSGNPLPDIPPPPSKGLRSPPFKAPPPPFERACAVCDPTRPGRRGSQPENSKRARAPVLQTTKIPREDTQRDTERAKWWREREEKARNFGLPTLRGPTFSRFGPPTLRGPTLRPPLPFSPGRGRPFPSPKANSTLTNSTLATVWSTLANSTLANSTLANSSWANRVDHPHPDHPHLDRPHPDRVCVCCVCWSKICVIPRTPRPSAGPPKISRFFSFSHPPFSIFFSLSGCLLVSFFFSLGSSR